MAWNRTFIGDDAAEARKFRLDENLRGAVLWMAAATALVGIAFGVMVVLTSPDGWATRIAQSATSSEDMSLVAYDISSAN
jgi:uncharacterized protein (UPF0212 family)